MQIWGGGPSSVPALDVEAILASDPYAVVGFKGFFLSCDICMGPSLCSQP